ncbi:MAG: beta-ketoacyl synthase chain length factor [Cyclobacteriaceae bacterium]
MTTYINGIGSISSQTPLNMQKISGTGQAIRAIEPDYTDWIEPGKLRRMSRIVTMGVASAMIALRDAAIEKPDAIVTGTGLGCLEDTGTFLRRMLVNIEGGITPTPFIQSTHNTIGSQIAMLLGCHGYNQTYTHQSFSLESALLDAQMLVKENEDLNVLVGSVDEFTVASHNIMQKFNLFDDNTPHGEGAAYFVVSATKCEKSYAKLIDQKTFMNPELSQLEDFIRYFITCNNKRFEEIDILIYGGTRRPGDAQVNLIINKLFGKVKTIWYKQFCGEYLTSTGFALWLSAMISKGQMDTNDILELDNYRKPVRNVLIYNPYLAHHSLILLESCRDIK